MTNYKLETDSDGIALVTWDAPGRSMNVIDVATILELFEIVEKTTADAAVKGVVITSGKDTFCAGADLTLLNTMSANFAQMAKSQGEEAAAKRLFEESRKLSQLYRRIETCGKPWVAALNGTALGSHWPAIIVSPPTTTRRVWVCRKSRSGCFPAPAAPHASRA
jgi:3-hydroxyacyl-CoA dehydrogenase/enoyl-CoA hydratase/3-hydroxybutyryl-CoA epimerase